MKKRVLFVQGGGHGAHEEDARLVANLANELGPDYQILYPVMPAEASPDYRAWNRILMQQLAQLGDDIIVVGHSVGASIVLWSFAENRPEQKLAGVFLIAPPFVGEGGWQVEGFTPPTDIATAVPNVPIYIYHGREDEIVPFAHVDLYASALSRAFIRRLYGRNHQLNDDLSEVASDIRSLNPLRVP